MNNFQKSIILRFFMSELVFCGHLENELMVIVSTERCLLENLFSNQSDIDQVLFLIAIWKINLYNPFISIK